MNNTPLTAPHLHARLRQHGFRGEAVSYSRPVAGGGVSAWHLTPATPPRGLVVFAHATGNDALYPQLSLFLRILGSGMAVFSFDLDGHGATSSTLLDPVASRSAISAAVGVATSRYEQRLPLHLVGQSLGGALALDAVAAGKIAPQTLTLISMPLQLAPSVSAGVVEMLGLATLPLAAPAALLEHCRDYGWRGALPAFGPFRRQAFPVRLSQSPSAFGYIKVVADLIASLQLPATAALIRAPTLLLYGALDHIAPVSQAETLARVIPKATLCRIGGGTHFTTPLFDKASAALVEFISTFSMPRPHGQSTQEERP